MTAHPMTRRARLLAEESGERWLILSLCDALDGMQEQLDAALCDMADMGDYQDNEDPAVSLARGLEAKRIAGERRRAA